MRFSEMMRLNEITRDASICPNLKQTVKISAQSCPFLRGGLQGVVTVSQNAPDEPVCCASEMGSIISNELPAFDKVENKRSNSLYLVF